MGPGSAWIWMSGAMLAVLALLTGGQGVAGKTRPAKTGTLMKVLHRPALDRIEQGLKASSPNEAGWEAIYEQAAILNEMSFVLMDDGRCPDKIWGEACGKMREGSWAIMVATDRKDVKASRAGAGIVKAACGSCHRTHKP